MSSYSRKHPHNTEPPPIWLYAPSSKNSLCTHTHTNRNSLKYKGTTDSIVPLQALIFGEKLDVKYNRPYQFYERLVEIFINLGVKFLVFPKKYAIKQTDWFDSFKIKISKKLSEVSTSAIHFFKARPHPLHSSRSPKIIFRH